MGIAERKEREKAERRRAILGAARELIREKIYEEITMDEIARRLELSRATLYLYFSNKSEIFLTLLVEGMEDLRKGYEKALEHGITEPLDKAKAMAVEFFRFYAENHSFFDLIVTKRAELVKESSEEVVERFSQSGTSLIHPVAMIYEEGVRAGTFRDHPPEKMAYLLRAVAIGVAVGFREGNLKFPEDLGLMEDMVFRGLVKSPSS